MATNTGSSGSGGNVGGSAPQRGYNPLVGKCCYKCGEADHFASMCAEYWQAKARGVPFVPPPPERSRTGRTMNVGTERRSHSADAMTTAITTTTAARSETDETNNLMREYLGTGAKEGRGSADGRKKAEKLEEKKRYEEERDARLLKTLLGELKKDYEGEGERKTVSKGRQVIKRNELGETREEEKERLLRLIASQEQSDDEEEEYEELVLLRRRAAGLRIKEKRKRGLVESPVGNSPPMVTPTKGQKTGLGKEAMAHIDEIKVAEQGKMEGTSTSTRRDLSKALEPTGKLGISMKHVTAGTGLGAMEKYERDLREVFEALTIDELKDQCKQDKISYENRDLALKRLIMRRKIQAYDPVNVPLPSTPGVTIRAAGRETASKEGAEEEKETSEEESEEDQKV
ncbi:hypothetical protein CBR_g31208 [Chara braunii]|uniref:CCHC-type domain-containing protein n=1 Tax=Chara braunii TaxID=69332 RepID=A0A388JXM6_CHABU|nr:hypothetical protein CBR_g31208 [Chara braunii]|eukprot:GBG62571.1 hypothetical protein CBR_g31208 [Chara braunii]